MSRVWTPEEREAKMRKIHKEAARTAARLGATGVVIVAFWRDGDDVHQLDGGRSPVPLSELYRQLHISHEQMAAGAGEDVTIQ